MGSPRFIEVCDIIRKELKLPVETSLQDLLVKFFDKHSEVALSNQTSTVEPTENKEKKRGRPKKSAS